MDLVLAGAEKISPFPIKLTVNPSDKVAKRPASESQMVLVLHPEGDQNSTPAVACLSRYRRRTGEPGAAL